MSHYTFFFDWNFVWNLLETLEFSIIVFPKISTNVTSINEKNEVLYFIRKYRDLFQEYGWILK